MKAKWCQQGFTLIEGVLVILLIAIVGAVASPLLSNYSLFVERFFVDEMLTSLNFAHKIATTTGCEVQIGYKSQKTLALFQRKNCIDEPFTRLVSSPIIFSDNPNYLIEIPTAISLKGSLPLYIDQDGKVYDQNHQWQQKISFNIKNHEIVIDGLTGFSYEKFSKN